MADRPDHTPATRAEVDALTRMIEADQRDLPELIRRAVADGVRDILDDSDLMHRFWRRGYSELTDHAGKGASQWVGRRLLTALVTAIVVAGAAWLVKTGNLK